MTLVEAGYACAPIVTLVGGVLLGRVTKRCRHIPDVAWAAAAEQAPEPAGETLLLPRVDLPATGSGWPPHDDRRPPVLGPGAQWVPRRRPSPRPRPQPYPSPPPPPNGRYAPGRAPAPRGEEWR